MLSAKSEILLNELGISKLLELRSWHSAVLPHVRGFFVSRCIEALDICGILEEFRANQSVKLEAFISAHKTFNAEALRIIFDYLQGIGVLKNNGDNYTLTSQGKRICINKHGYFDLIEAYSPLFLNLPKIVLGEMQYGKDVVRKEFFVSKGTAEVSEWLPLPSVRYLIKKYDLRNILDLGCGRGELLLSTAMKIPQGKFYGIDIAKESIEEGVARLQRLGLQDRVFLKTGDLNHPEEWQDWLKGADVITIMFVVHELVYLGEDYIVNLLRKLKQYARPDAFFLITETPRVSPENIMKKPTSIAEHHLFHQLSGQGIFTPAQFRSIMEKAGLEIVEDLLFNAFSQHYILAK